MKSATNNKFTGWVKKLIPVTTMALVSITVHAVQPTTGFMTKAILFAAQQTPKGTRFYRCISPLTKLTIPIDPKTGFPATGGSVPINQGRLLWSRVVPSVSPRLVYLPKIGFDVAHDPSYQEPVKTPSELTELLAVINNSKHKLSPDIPSAIKQKAELLHINARNLLFALYAPYLKDESQPLGQLVWNVIADNHTLAEKVHPSQEDKLLMEQQESIDGVEMALQGHAGKLLQHASLFVKPTDGLTVLVHPCGPEVVFEKNCRKNPWKIYNNTLEMNEHPA